MKHIPQAETTQMELLPFERALEESGKGDEYDTEKWIYVPDHYTEYRYILGTRGQNPLICIGINPSTAKPEALDNTLKSVQRIADGNGFDSFIMFNVYAQRATEPDQMDRIFNTTLHEENMKAFEYILAGVGEGVTPTVWAAWGAIIEKRAYLPQCVREMVRIGTAHGARWVAAGPISKKGHPHHPLYLRSDEKIRPFDVNAYLDAQEKQK